MPAYHSPSKRRPLGADANWKASILDICAGHNRPIGSQDASADLEL
jgi:hypothetical protein